MTVLHPFPPPSEHAPSRASQHVRACTRMTSEPGQTAALHPDSVPTPNEISNTRSAPRRVVEREILPDPECPRSPQWASQHGAGESHAMSVHDLSGALRELRNSIREGSGCQVHGQGLCTVQPDDLSLCILAFAERYESRDQPTSVHTRISMSLSINATLVQLKIQLRLQLRPGSMGQT